MVTLSTIGRQLDRTLFGVACVYAQVIKYVVDFLGLDEATGPALSPAALAERYLDILGHADFHRQVTPRTVLGEVRPDRRSSLVVGEGEEALEQDDLRHEQGLSSQWK